MTLTALTRFVSKNRPGDVRQVERDGQGGANVYFQCKDRKTGKLWHFVVGCSKAEKIRVYPESFTKLSIRAEGEIDPARKLGKRRKILYFDEMYIIGYGFDMLDIPVG